MPDYQPQPGTIRDFSAGQTIFKGDDQGDFMYVVLNGTVRLSLTTMDVEDVSAGGFLGEMALLESAPRSATAMAATNCTLQEIDRAGFLFRVTQTPFFAIQVMRTMAHRIRRMNRHVNRDTRFSRSLAVQDVTPTMLKAAKHIQTIPQGAFILRQNEDGREMYCIRRGRAELRINNVVVETIGVGGLLGELALLDREPRTATAVAVEECDVLVFDQERFEYLMALTPDFALRVMKILARRLRAIDRAVEEQS